MDNRSKDVRERTAAQEAAAEEAAAAALKAKSDEIDKAVAAAMAPNTNTIVRDGDDPNAFIKQLMESRSAPPPEPPPPGKPTARQWSQTELEMQAGADRVKFFKKQQAERPVPPPDAGTGSTTPVFRPEAYIHERAGKDGARK